MNLDAYFDRIGWGGPTTLTLDTRAGLLAAQMTHVPFEILDVLLGRRPRLAARGGGFRGSMPIGARLLSPDAPPGDPT